MKVKLFSVHKGINTHYVLATGINDAYAYFTRYHIIKSHIKKVANVEVTFDQLADPNSYRHDRNDLPSGFGMYSPVSDKVYSKIMDDVC